MPTSAGHMAEFFERLGHTIFQSPSAYWYDVWRNVAFSIPYYRPIEPPEEELRELLIKHKLLALRFPTKLNNYGFVSNVIINTNTDYDLSSLHQKARNQTRHALEHCTIEQIDFDFLHEHGLKLNVDTARRQQRESQYAYPNYWRNFCSAAKAVEGITAWGAFVEGRLATFLVAVEAGDWVEWIVNHSSTELRNKNPNNALAFTVAQHFFRVKKCAGICYGLGSLEPTPDLDHFKQRMGWKLEPIKQRLVFAKKLALATTIAQEPLLKVAGVLFPRSYKIRKTSAMIRLYRKQTAELPDLAESERSQERDHE